MKIENLLKVKGVLRHYEDDEDEDSDYVYKNHKETIHLDQIETISDFKEWEDYPSNLIFVGFKSGYSCIIEGDYEGLHSIWYKFINDKTNSFYIFAKYN